MHDELKHKYSLPWRFKKAWTKALRSGDYIQGAGTLRRDSTVNNPEIAYCCLGVACVVAGVSEDRIEGEFIDDYQIKYESVPEVLQGVADENELIKVLTDMNDNCSTDEDRHKFNFDNIADWIDDNIKTTR